VVCLLSVSYFVGILRPSLESLPGQTRGLPIRELLGLDDRFAVYDLCKKYDIVLYTLEDLEQDRATARQLGL
jgi:hypothetical protein